MVNILDCTIRDGGYVNNWMFSTKQVRECYRALVKSHVDYMEIGFRDSIRTYSSVPVGPWKTCSESLIRSTIGDIYTPTTRLALMVNFENVNLDLFPPRKSSLVSMIRIAFHEKDLDGVLETAKHFKMLGYEVALNAMGISYYDEQSLRHFCEIVVESNADYAYIADTYGSLNQIRLARIWDIMSEYDVHVGYHAHNNLQKALSNAVYCIQKGAKLVDVTMHGMGRGAGNLCTELLLSEYSPLNVFPVVEYIADYLIHLDSLDKWGYSLVYFISGHLNIHPNYIWKMVQYNITDIRQIWEVASQIQESKRGNVFVVGLLDAAIESLDKNDD